MFNSIVVAVDGSSHSSRALAFAAELAATNNAELGIIFVVENNIYGLPGALPGTSSAEHVITPTPNLFTHESLNSHNFKFSAEAAQESYRLAMKFAEHIIEDAEKNARVDGAEKITRYIGTGSVINEIIDFATRQNADIIVTGQRGLGALKSVLLGSTSMKLAQSAPCTSVIVR